MPEQRNDNKTPKRKRSISLHPLEFEEVLSDMLQVKPESKDKKSQVEKVKQRNDKN